MKLLNWKSKINYRVDNSTALWMGIIILFVMLIATVFYCSGDLGATASHGVYLWDSFFSGQFLHLYSDYIDNPMTTTAFYSFPLYILFGIWNLPTYILYKLGIPFLEAKTILTFSTMVWNKLLIILFIMLMLKALNDIACEYSVSTINRKWLLFSTVSSFFVMYPALIIGQYDVISTAVSLMGIAAYLKNDNKKFIIAFALATGLKFFAVFIFVPLILLEEKNIFKAFLKSCTAFIVPLISFLLFRGDAGYLYVNEFSKQKIVGLFERTIPGNFSVVPIVALLLICIYLWSYSIDPGLKKEYAIYISFATYGVLFCFMFIATYWIILIIPYMMLICFLNLDKQQKTSVNFIISLAAELSMCILTLYYHHDNLDYALLYRGILYEKLAFGAPKFSIYGLVENMGLGIFILCFEALFIACMFFMFFMNIPSLKNQLDVINVNEQKLIGHDKCLLIIKSFITILFILLSIICMKFPIKYSFDFLKMDYKGGVTEEADSYSIGNNSTIETRKIVLQPGEYFVEITGDSLDKDGIDYFVQDNGEYGGAYDFIICSESVNFKLSVPQYTENVKIVINTNENKINVKKVSLSNLTQTE